MSDELRVSADIHAGVESFLLVKCRACRALLDPDDREAHERSLHRARYVTPDELSRAIGPLASREDLRGALARLSIRVVAD